VNVLVVGTGVTYNTNTVTAAAVVQGGDGGAEGMAGLAGTGTPPGTGGTDGGPGNPGAVGGQGVASNPNVAGSSEPETPLGVETTSLPAGTYGKAYSADLESAGGYTPYAWKISAGKLPPGLKLSTSGVISGKPTGKKAKTSKFTVKATDALGSTATKVLSIVVS
jgi:hypothetical protein